MVAPTRQTPITRPGVPTSQGDHRRRLLALERQPTNWHVSNSALEGDTRIYCNGNSSGRVHPTTSSYFVTWDGRTVGDLMIATVSVVLFGVLGGTLGGGGTCYVIGAPFGYEIAGFGGMGYWTNTGTGVLTPVWPASANVIDPYPGTGKPNISGFCMRLDQSSLIRPGVPIAFGAGDSIFTGTIIMEALWNDDLIPEQTDPFTIQTTGT